jgi:hypothetical protein
LPAAEPPGRLAGREGPEVPRAIWGDSPPRGLTLLVGHEALKIIGGFERWETVPRTLPKAATQWVGSQPFVVTFSVLLRDPHGLGAARSVEPQLRALIALAAGDGESAPGVVNVRGLPLPTVDGWVISDLDFDDPLLRAKEPARIEQEVRITLTECVDAPTLKLLRGGGWAARGYRTKWIRAHAGDTVSKVARRYGCDWRDLKRYNYDDVKGRFVVHSAAQKLPPP